MRVIDQSISLAELVAITQRSGWNLIKAVIDIEKEVMVIDAELQADEEAELLRLGSQQKNLWGINLYPDLFGEEDFIEFDSMINVRPSQGNLSRGVENVDIKQKIQLTVGALIQ